MGILDDAIRQHLELKRRQGAADDELERLEGEAFGPPTRPGEPDFPSAEPALEAPPSDEPGAAADAEQTEIAAEAVEAQEPAVAFKDTSPAAAVAPEPSSSEGEMELDLDLELDDDFSALGAAEPAPAAPPAAEPVAAPDTAEHPAPIESLDTVEHAVEGPPPEEGESPSDVRESGEEEVLEGEDVLEETPEFLRDQPEDDELWFEQGEPKDFDF